MTESSSPPETGRHRRAVPARSNGGGALLGWLPAVGLIALVGISGSSAGLDGQSVAAQLAATDPTTLSGPLAPGELVASLTAPELAVTPPVDAAPANPVPTGALGAAAGIPATVLEAYRRAAQTLAGTHASCRLPWSLLAGVGRVESVHASQGRVDAAGNTRGAILGIPLNGSRNTAAIRDTDGGQLDGDALWDRAVGAMQFIPSTWKRFAADGDGDGIASPHNVFDAALTAGQYLCGVGGDLSRPAGQVAALMAYNHSAAYGALVRRWAALYDGQVTAVPGAAGEVPPAPVTVPPAAVARLAAHRQPLPAPVTPVAAAVAAPAPVVPIAPVQPAGPAAVASASTVPASAVTPTAPAPEASVTAVSAAPEDPAAPVTPTPTEPAAPTRTASPAEPAPSTELAAPAEPTATSNSVAPARATASPATSTRTASAKRTASTPAPAPAENESAPTRAATASSGAKRSTKAAAPATESSPTASRPEPAADLAG